MIKSAEFLCAVQPSEYRVEIGNRAAEVVARFEKAACIPDLAFNLFSTAAVHTQKVSFSTVDSDIAVTAA